MNELKKKLRFSQIAICMIIVVTCGYVIWCGNDPLWEKYSLNNIQGLRIQIQRMYLPGLMYMQEDQPAGLKQQVVTQAMHMIPLAGYLERKIQYTSKTEDETTREMILSLQAHHENEVNEKGEFINKTAAPIADTAPLVAPTLDLSIERLRDFNYLINNFYIVDNTTMIEAPQLNPDDLLNRNMKITKQNNKPKVLIFHTHSQEAFVDSTPGDANTSIVGVGSYLTQILNEQYNISTIHNEGIYDLIDGKLDRSSAYEFAETQVKKILAENPSIEVVIDLHRDGVNQNTHLLTEANGKPTAQIMFFNGLSRTRANGDIPYLENPYIQDNLAFSLQMKLASEQMYPGFTRKNYLSGYRFSLHMMPKSLLIEAGAQTNTVEEMRNAMEILSKILSKVITE